MCSKKEKAKGGKTKTGSRGKELAERIAEKETMDISKDIQWQQFWGMVGGLMEGV